MEFSRKDHLAGFAAGVKAAQRGNGAGGLHVVPAVEHMMLSAALAKVTEFETLLEAARNDARSAARRSGVKLSGLFSKSSFIRRETGERWADEAREEGAEERTRVIADGLQAGRNPDPSFAPAREWAAEVLRRRRAAGIADDDKLTVDQYFALMDGKFVAADDDVEAAAKAKADAIIKAAAKRDAGGTVPFEKPSPAAQKILNAGAKRRRGLGEDK